MKRADAIAFLERPWGALEELRRARQLERYSEGGPAASLRAARRLRLRYLRVRTEAQAQAARDRDLQHHIDLKHRVDQAAGGFTRR